MNITRGALLEVTTATGETARMRATSAPERGRDFPIVWACTVAEFDVQGADCQEKAGIPWPLAAVRQVLETPADREPVAAAPTTATSDSP